jgi:hypothetical protein
MGSQTYGTQASRRIDQDRQAKGRLEDSRKAIRREQQPADMVSLGRDRRLSENAVTIHAWFSWTLMK